MPLGFAGQQQSVYAPVGVAAPQGSFAAPQASFAAPQGFLAAPQGFSAAPQGSFAPPQPYPQYGMSAMNSFGGTAGVPSMQEVIHHYSKRTGGWKNLGPIIGLVTDTSARVLVEFTQEQEVTLIASPIGTKEGCQPGGPCQDKKRAMANRPVVFVLTGLSGGVKYSLTLQGSFGMVPNIGSFFTVPPGGYRLGYQSPRFVVKSCDCYYNTRDKVEPESDLWRDLADRIERDEIDCIVHIGDNVYNDTDYCDIEKGKKVGQYTADEDCKWNIARKFIENLPPQQWPTAIEQVREVFRAAYRETWGHPPAAFAFAHCPNLMIFDDHEVRDDWGDRPGDKDRSSLDWFLASQCYFVICEYQRVLFEDTALPAQWSPQTWPRQTFYFQVFGDVGVYMQDIRGCKTFHYNEQTDLQFPMMGAHQWSELERALSPGGIFSQCRILIVAGPEPYAYATTKATQLGAKVIDDMYGHWMAEKHVPEMKRFLHAMFMWREQAPLGARDVVLLGGDVHEGGWTRILHKGEGYDFQRDSMQQLTASAMSYHLRTNIQQLVSAGTKNTGDDLTSDFKFRHYQWTSLCNYGIVQCFQGELGEATYEGKLVAGGPRECYERSVSHPDYDPHFGEDVIFEARDIAKSCSVQ